MKEEFQSNKIKCSIMLSSSFSSSSSSSSSTAGHLPYVAEACSVYCEGPLLRTVQLSNLFNDSKTFVDMPMKRDPADILQDFAYLIGNYSNLDNDLLGKFIDFNFYEAGSDLLVWLPSDYDSKPSFIDKIPHAPYRAWAYSINELWKDLGKIVNHSWVSNNPSRHSFLPRSHGMIVPGGRFRESYYWDSYFTILGLLSCDMHNTTRSVIDNLLDDVSNFGFVPNGGRIYYLDRSQPPLLSDMTLAYYNYMTATSTTAASAAANTGPSSRIDTILYLNNSFFVLNVEYNWWMNPSNGHVVNILDPAPGSSRNYVLNRYFSNFTSPRPESFYVDYYNGYFNGQFPNNISKEYNFNDDKYEDAASNSSSAAFFHSIRAAAESGWDFSSRWINSSFVLDSNELFESYESSFNISSIDTVSIVPVDLNSIMYRFECNMKEIATILNRELSNYYGGQNIYYDYSGEAELFNLRASARKEAINSILWDKDKNKWSDYNTSSKRLSSLVSLSSWAAPLWAGLYPDNAGDRDRIVTSFIDSRLIREHGLLTTTLITGQQWDSPNAWPPLVYMTIEGLTNLDTSNSKNLASNITSTWLETCYNAHKESGFEYEKYDANSGKGGGGGEYVPQRGFGWTNGVALCLLKSTILTTSGSPSSDDYIDFWSSTGGIALIIVCICTLVVFTFCSCKYYFGKSKSNNTDFQSFINTITEPLVKGKYSSVKSSEKYVDSDDETVDNNIQYYRRSNNGNNNISMHNI